jgi:hypothetical protein
MRGRRQADEKQSRVRVAEAWDGAPPICVVAMRSFALACDVSAVAPQARAPFARNNGRVDVSEAPLLDEGDLRPLAQGKFGRKRFHQGIDE